MSLPVPSPESAQLLLLLWLGFLLFVGVGYAMVRWWHARTRTRAKPPAVRRKDSNRKPRGHHRR